MIYAITSEYYVIDITQYNLFIKGFLIILKKKTLLKCKTKT